jgi:hypothetical protein
MPIHKLLWYAPYTPPPDDRQSIGTSAGSESLLAPGFSTLFTGQAPSSLLHLHAPLKNTATVSPHSFDLAERCPRGVRLSTITGPRVKKGALFILGWLAALGGMLLDDVHIP